jgi:hypothetical protein
LQFRRSYDLSDLKKNIGKLSTEKVGAVVGAAVGAKLGVIGAAAGAFLGYSLAATFAPSSAAVRIKPGTEVKRGPGEESLEREPKETSVETDKPCPHCGQGNPEDNLLCIYCGEIIGD